jgi:hypothetical protein
MRTTRTITASLVAVLGAAALAGPAAADSHKQPDSRYPGKSTSKAAMRSHYQSADDSVTANVYLPPTAAFGHTAAPAHDSVKANVYVPPTTESGDTVAPAHDSVTANVYVPPTPGPIHRHVPAAAASSSDFDWGSARIGAAVAIGAFLITLGGAAVLRRRRQIQPAAAG